MTAKPCLRIAHSCVRATGKVEEVTAADWTRVLDVNVKGFDRRGRVGGACGTDMSRERRSYAFCMKFAMPLLRAQGGGSIVNISRHEMRACL